MASRPFGSVLVELEKSSDVFANSTNPNSREEAHIRRRRRVRFWNP